MPVLPISTALREALPESISDLYSRDIEGMSDADIDRIIRDQRINRERIANVESITKRTPKEEKAPRPSGISIQGLEI
jgi:hypothetical protein